jgi:hypothetical protein
MQGPFNRYFKPMAIMGVFLFSINAFAWGPTGHRIVGAIAERHLSPCAKEKIHELLQGESLAMASTWMDNIKSDPSYRSWNPWHYCTIPDHQSYEEAGTPKQGDIIATLHRLMVDPNARKLMPWDEATGIKMVAHLVGDIHQPLHVGNGTDRGGNDWNIQWFSGSTNLHRVWDSDMIKHQALSYTEYADWIDRASEADVQSWQADDVLVWAQESKTIRLSGIYPDVDTKSLGYAYSYKHISTLNQRLLQAGIRLAAVLNSMYGC